MPGCLQNTWSNLLIFLTNNILMHYVDMRPNITKLSARNNAAFGKGRVGWGGIVPRSEFYPQCISLCSANFWSGTRVYPLDQSHHTIHGGSYKCACAHADPPSRKKNFSPSSSIGNPDREVCSVAREARNLGNFRDPSIAEGTITVYQWPLIYPTGKVRNHYILMPNKHWNLATNMNCSQA